MHFYQDKCEVIFMTKKPEAAHRAILHSQKGAGCYHQCQVPRGQRLQNLYWVHYIDSVLKKENNATASLQSNLASCRRSIKDKCYKTTVRPRVQYASSVWNPNTKRNINRVEQVQKRAAKFATNNYSSTSSNNVVGTTELDTLHQTRTKTKTTIIYRVVHCLVAKSLPS